MSELISGVLSLSRFKWGVKHSPIPFSFLSRFSFPKIFEPQLEPYAVVTFDPIYTRGAVGSL